MNQLIDCVIAGLHPEVVVCTLRGAYGDLPFTTGTESLTELVEACRPMAVELAVDSGEVTAHMMQLIKQRSEQQNSNQLQEVHSFHPAGRRKAADEGSITQAPRIARSRFPKALPRKAHLAKALHLFPSKKK